MTLTPASLPALTLPADALRDALRACLPASSRDATRSHLTGVRLAYTAADRVIHADATDGHRLHTVRISLTGSDLTPARDAAITLTLAGAETAIRTLTEILRGVALTLAAAEKAHAKAVKAHKGKAADAPVLRSPVPLVTLDTSGALSVAGVPRGVATVQPDPDQDLPARATLDRVAALSTVQPAPRIGLCGKYVAEACKAVDLFRASGIGLFELRGELDAIRVSAPDDLRLYPNSSVTLTFRATIMPARV
jgi:hypothetical protein